MNPLEFTGPDFLLFYFCFASIVILFVWYLRRRAESGPVPKMDLSDPYLIAYLRGGENEVLRLGVVTLIDRGLLAVDGTRVVQTEQAIHEKPRHPVEYEVLNKFRAKSEASSIFRDTSLKKVCAPYRSELEGTGLLPGQSAKGDRRFLFTLAVALLAGLGMMKIFVGISRDRPVSFLVIMMIAAVVIAGIASFPRLTMRGRKALEDMRAIYAGLKDRASDLRRGSATAEMTMLAAVFGISALTPVEYGFARSIFPQASGSACGSSCGSSGSDSGSSGGGGSCGGGGCGGCGS